MKRYAISPVIGSGTFTDPYRVSVSDVSGVNSAADIPSNQSTGAPLYRFAFCQVAVASSLAGVLAVTNLYAFPDYVLDGQMSGMDPALRSAMNQDVAAYDFTGAGMHLNMAFYGDPDSYRTVLNGVADQLESAFDINHLGVTEPVQ